MFKLKSTKKKKKKFVELNTIRNGAPQKLK